MEYIAYLSASETSAMIRAGRLSSTSLLERLLERIDRLEPVIKAWITIDREGALRAARELDAEARDGSFRGPLHGIPAGIKDIIHVAQMPTTFGAGHFARAFPEADAPSVARLRRAGAIILGKTTTTEFAYRDPPETTNPWNSQHTPGGSSAGSAAAVSAGMIPVALGTQTIGSTLRPAAYCGIVGFKPTHGRIILDGVHPLAPSLDHMGILCRSVDDAALVFSILTDDAPANFAARLKTGGPPRIGILKEFFFAHADPPTQANLGSITAAIAREGAQLAEVELPQSFQSIHEAANLLVEVEAASIHRMRFAEQRNQYRVRMKALLERGGQHKAVDYLEALEKQRRFREEVARLIAQFDAILMPTTPTPAPLGLESTGDSSFCAPWSFAGFPAISLPSGVTDEGLPLAVQLVSRAHCEGQLLALGRWCERVVGFRASPEQRVSKRDLPAKAK